MFDHVFMTGTNLFRGSRSKRWIYSVLGTHSTNIFDQLKYCRISSMATGDWCWSSFHWGREDLEFSGSIDFRIVVHRHRSVPKMFVVVVVVVGGGNQQSNCPAQIKTYSPGAFFFQQKVHSKKWPISSHQNFPHILGATLVVPVGVPTWKGSSAARCLGVMSNRPHAGQAATVKDILFQRRTIPGTSSYNHQQQWNFLTFAPILCKFTECSRNTTWQS